MAVDNISHEEAHEKMIQIESTAIGNMALVGLMPYRVGITGVGLLALTTCPMIFDYTTVLWFNEHFVTADVPEAKDLETWLEVDKIRFEGLI